MAFKQLLWRTRFEQHGKNKVKNGITCYNTGLKDFDKLTFIQIEMNKYLKMNNLYS